MNYPDWTKQQLLLLWFWNRLQDAYDSGESSLSLGVVRGGDDAGVYAWVPVGDSEEGDPNVHSRQVNISDEIAELKRGGEAVAVFDRLWREGYIDVNFGSRDPFSEGGMPTLLDLTNRGRADIGKFPDPDRRLAAALEAVRHSIGKEPDTPHKGQRLETVERMISLVNNSREVGTVVIKALGQIGGGSLG